MEYLVGIDDTDSASGMCTTYLAYYITSSAKSFSVKAYPRLVRLNPNIPFKTRGNASVCLDIDTENPSKAFSEICNYVKKLSDVSHGANSGVVFAKKETRNKIFAKVYQHALTGVVNHRRVKRILEENNVPHYTLGNGMGLVGASAAIGFDMKDYTFELIAYRMKENWGKPRIIDPKSVVEMDLATFPQTFNNFDYEKERVLIAPHGPDPVLFGIRADNPEILLKAFNLIRTEEQPDGYLIYLSNQHTDAHLCKKIEEKSFSSGWVEGIVKSVKRIRGGHIMVELHGVGFPLAVYSPTGDLARVASRLMKGDRIKAYGGMRKPSKNHKMTLNIEKIEVISVERNIYTNPTCFKCGIRMKSEGSGKGFECRKCGSRRKCKVVTTIEREILPGIYLSSPRAHRHLTKPYARYNSYRITEPFYVEKWFCAESRNLLLSK